MNGRNTVWEAVEAFRRTHLATQAGKLPVDVFSLVELVLRIDVIPFDDLTARYRVDAALTQDFQSLYVDAESYVLWEKGPVWKQNRLRFTVAHELGHYVLHRDHAARIKFSTFDEFARHFRGEDADRFGLEQEANEFAGRLLVPRDRLQEQFDRFAASIESIVPAWLRSEDLRLKFAESVAPRFGVHSQALLTRLEREGFWPAP
jgi:Zn-dependent peptidase ImmA (M78 family)